MCQSYVEGAAGGSGSPQLCMQSDCSSRAFLRRLREAMSGLTKPYHRLRTSAGMKDDLQIWLQFLDGFNRISFWRDKICLGAGFQVHSDAARSTGYDIYFRGQWCASLWPME